MTDSIELAFSFAVCLVLSGVYIGYSFVAEPAGGQPFGHWLGIIGTLLMVSTETLYSLRKRVRWVNWAGPLRWWLSVHIFTGIVGPFLVLMHTGLQFRGLAGFTLALTALVVASGFVGRYFFTAIPHTMANAEATASELLAEVTRVQTAIEALITQRSAAVQMLVAADAQRPRVRRDGVMLVLMRGWDDWQYRRRLRARVKSLEKTEKQQLSDVERMLERRRTLERQVRMLDGARKVMSWWHIAHVPMGLALFGSAAIHAIATFYYGAGLWPLLP